MAAGPGLLKRLGRAAERWRLFGEECEAIAPGEGTRRAPLSLGVRHVLQYSISSRGPQRFLHPLSIAELTVRTPLPRGGKARAAALSAKGRAEIAKKAAAQRWRKRH